MREDMECIANAALRIDGVAELFRHVGSRLVIECEPELPAVDVDADALDRILKNLITNALKYSPTAFPVHVVAGHDVSGGVRFSVRDRGAGISPEALPHVFEPYRQAHGDRGGTGLGLAIVRGVAQAHDGRVTVESQEGKGSRFTVLLPRS